MIGVPEDYPVVAVDGLAIVVRHYIYEISSLILKAGFSVSGVAFVDAAQTIECQTRRWTLVRRVLEVGRPRSITLCTDRRQSLIISTISPEDRPWR